MIRFIKSNNEKGNADGMRVYLDVNGESSYTVFSYDFDAILSFSNLIILFRVFPIRSL